MLSEQNGWSNGSRAVVPVARPASTATDNCHRNACTQHSIAVRVCSATMGNGLADMIQRCLRPPEPIAMKMTRHAAGAASDVDRGRMVCVSKYLSQGTAVCAVAAVRGCVPASVSTHCFRVNSTSYGVSALVPLRPSGELPVRLLPAARGRYLYPPSPVSLVRLGVTRPLQFTVCYAGTEGLGT